MKILSVDIGTTAMKMGVFEEHGNDLKCLRQFFAEYAINTYNDGLFSDIEPQKWQQAFAAGCKEMARNLNIVGHAERRMDSNGVQYLLAERKKKWKAPSLRHPRGVLKRYASQAVSAIKGAYLE